MSTVRFESEDTTPVANKGANLRLGQKVRYHGAYPCDAKIIKMEPKTGVCEGFNRLTLETAMGDKFEADEWNVHKKSPLDLY